MKIVISDILNSYSVLVSILNNSTVSKFILTLFSKVIDLVVLLYFSSFEIWLYLTNITLDLYMHYF